MSHRFWGCCNCDCYPELFGNGSGEPYGNISGFSLHTDCSSDKCVELLFTMTFASNRIAAAVVGSGNYTPSTISTPATVGPWVLFNRGGEPAWDRDESRSVSCSVELIAHPTDPDSMIVGTFTVGDELTWERVSTDPESADFQKFELTNGSIDSPPYEPAGDYCLNVQIGAVRCAYVQESSCADDDTCKMGLTATLESGDPILCDSENVNICMEQLGAFATFDDWLFGGEWYGAFTYGEEDECGQWAYLRIGQGALNPFPIGDCTGTLGEFQIWNAGCRLYGVWEECSHDPRECPKPEDFVITEGPGSCDGSLTGLTCGSCEGTSNCPPEECPGAYCKYVWDVDEQIWVLDFSNCLGGMECPPTLPDDPEVMDVPHVYCVCCVEVTPQCDANNVPCPGDECGWVWDAAFSIWTTAGACETIGCTCQGMPEDPGLFDGDTRPGICCAPI
jgi:hypothetical protein